MSETPTSYYCHYYNHTYIWTGKGLNILHTDRGNELHRKNDRTTVLRTAVLKKQANKQKLPTLRVPPSFIPSDATRSAACHLGIPALGRGVDCAPLHS